MVDNEEASIKDAHSQQIRNMHGVLLDALIQSQDDACVEEACQRFLTGLALTRKATALASKMIADQQSKAAPRLQ